MDLGDVAVRAYPKGAHGLWDWRRSFATQKVLVLDDIADLWAQFDTFEKQQTKKVDFPAQLD